MSSDWMAEGGGVGVANMAPFNPAVAVSSLGRLLFASSSKAGRYINSFLTAAGGGFFSCESFSLDIN